MAMVQAAGQIAPRLQPLHHLPPAIPSRRHLFEVDSICGPRKQEIFGPSAAGGALVGRSASVIAQPPTRYG